MDVSLGAYPYVSSSSTIASGVITGGLVAIKNIGCVVGVVKSFATRIGKGPFPSEIKDKKIIEQLKNPVEHSEHKKLSLVKPKEETLSHIISKVTKEVPTKKDVEKDVETLILPTETKLTDHKHNQRYGWLDLVMLRQSILINGINCMVITHLDHLDDLDEIYMCYDYVIDGVNYDYLPPVASKAAKIVPRYMKFEGWKKCTRGVRHFSDLPQNARNYLNKVSALAGVPISYVSVGEDNSEIIPHKHDLIPL
jgi:adenylosuccinate synthase